MVIAGVVIQTLPGRVEAVGRRLAAVPGLHPRGDDGDARIAATWRAASGEELEERAETLVAGDEDVLGVYTTFAAEEGDEPTATAQEPAQG